MRRIVFLINSLAGGGAERVMTTVLAGSRDYLDRHELHLILLDRNPEVYEVPAFVTLHRLDARKSLLRSLSQLAPLLARLKPDVVTSFLTRSNLANLALAAPLGYRPIISERAHTSGHHHGVSGAISKRLIRLLYPHAHRIIAVSHGIAQDLAGNFAVPLAKIVTIANPLDTALIRARAAEPIPPPVTGPYILGMGRLTPAKNFALLIKAFAASDYRGHLVIAGQGPEQSALQALAATLGIADRVVLPGFRDNPFPWLLAADGYVLCSNAEGFPNGLLEAMALARPVIATNCPTGPAEILDAAIAADITGLHQARYGLLVPTNAIEPMRQAICLLADADRRADLSARARAGAARFSLEPTIAAYWQVIAGAQPASTE